MSPTREDLIVHLTAIRGATVAALALHFACDADDVRNVLDANDDFEHGYSQAWRLSVLASNPDTRTAALRQQRDIEQPPQRREPRPVSHGYLPHSGGHVLIDWLMANPGEWTLTQIAEARGTSVVTVREHVRHHRDRLITRRKPEKGRPLVVSLRPLLLTGN